MSARNDYCAGHFLAAFSPVPMSGTPAWVTIGSTTEGFNIETTLHEEEIHDDRFGQGVADVVQEGSDVHVSGILLNIGVVESSGVLYSQVPQGASNNNAGKLGSQLYGSLCLTPVAGTPAAALLGAGNSYVFRLCAIMNNVNYLLANKHRSISVSWRCLPDQSDSNLFWTIGATPAGVPSTYP